MFDIGVLTGKVESVGVPYGNTGAVINLRYKTADEITALMDDLRSIHTRKLKAVKASKAKETPAMLDADGLDFFTALGEALVTGWSGVTENGGELPYSPELCGKMLLRLDTFRKFVLATCHNGDAMVAAYTESVVKN